MPLKTTKRILTAAAIAGFFLVLIYSLLFTTAEIPASLATFASAAASREKHTALVLKRFPRETLQPGDLILVKINDGTTSTREIRRLEQIQQPNQSQRMKASGRNRRFAQAILDMDFKPTYWVSAQSTNSPPISIPESDILGKAVHTFGK